MYMSLEFVLGQIYKITIIIDMDVDDVSLQAPRLLSKYNLYYRQMDPEAILH